MHTKKQMLSLEALDELLLPNAAVTVMPDDPTQASIRTEFTTAGESFTFVFGQDQTLVVEFSESSGVAFFKNNVGHSFGLFYGSNSGFIMDMGETNTVVVNYQAPGQPAATPPTVPPATIIVNVPVVVDNRPGASSGNVIVQAPPTVVVNVGGNSVQPPAGSPAAPVQIKPEDVKAITDAVRDGVAAAVPPTGTQPPGIYIPPPNPVNGIIGALVGGLPGSIIGGWFW